MDILGTIKALSTFGADRDAQLANDQLQRAQAQQALSLMDQQAKYFGGYSPTAGKIINADPSAAVSLFNPPSQASAAPPAGASAANVSTPPGASGTPQPDDTAKAMMSLAGAYPAYRDIIMKTMATRAQLGDQWNTLSPTERFAAVNDPANFSKQGLENRAATMQLVDPATGRTLTVSKAAWLSDPGSYRGLVEAEKYNPQTAASNAETARHNKQEEALGARDVKVDRFGNPIVVDKVTGKTINGSGPNRPWADAAPTAPVTPSIAAPATPAPSGATLTKAPLAATTPSPVAPMTGPQIAGAQSKVPTAASKAPQQFAYDTPFIQSMSDLSKSRFARLTPEQQLVVGPMLDGNTAPPEAGKAIIDPNGQDILAAAAWVLPGFNEQVWRQKNDTIKSFAGQGPDAINTTAIDQALGHLDELNSAGQAMHNRMFQPWNYVANAVESGGLDNPAQDNFHRAQQSVATELAKIYKGVGVTPEGEIEDWKKTFNPDAGPKRLAEMAPATIRMLDSRLDALHQKWENGMGTPDGMPALMSPDTQRKYDILSGGKGKYASPEAQAAAAKGLPIGLPNLGIGQSTSIGNAKVTRVK